MSAALASIIDDFVSLARFAYEGGNMLLRLEGEGLSVYARLSRLMIGSKNRNERISTTLQMCDRFGTILSEVSLPPPLLVLAYSFVPYLLCIAHM